MGSVLDLAVGGKEALAVLDAGSGADDLPEGLAHSVGDTVGAGTGRLLVLPEHVVGELPEDHLVPLLADLLQEVTIGTESRGLHRAVADLALLLDVQRDLHGVLRRVDVTVAHLVLGDLRAGNPGDVLPPGVGGFADLPVHGGGLVGHRYSILARDGA